MKKIISMILIVSLLFVFVGCSTNEQGEEKTDGQETEKPAQGVYEDKIVVGNSAATSGPLATVGGPFIAGMESYFNYINEEGGVNGRMIEFVHKDDEFDPSKGKAALTELVEDDEIFALVGHFGTPVVGATIEDIKNYGIPSVYFATGIGQLYFDEAVGNERAIFPVQPIYKTEGQIMLVRAYKDFEAKKVGIIYTGDDAGKDLLEGAKLKAEELSVEIVEEQIAAGSTDVSSAVTKIKNAEVDFIIIAAIQQTFPTVVKELAAQAVNKDAITTYVNVDPTIAALVSSDIKGKFDVYGLGWVSLDETNQEELATFAQKTPEYETNVFAMTGWIAASFFVEGLERVEGVVTWEKFIDAMESAPVKNPFGGEIDYSNGKRLGTQEMNLSKIDVEKPEGAWVSVDGLKSMNELLEK